MVNCPPALVNTHLKQPDNTFLPFEIQGIRRGDITKVSSFIEDEARRSGKSVQEVIDAINRLEVNEVLTYDDFVRRLDVELSNPQDVTPAGKTVSRTTQPQRASLPSAYRVNYEDFSDEWKRLIRECSP